MIERKNVFGENMETENNFDKYAPYLGARLELEGGMNIYIKNRLSRGGQIQVSPCISTFGTEVDAKEMARLFGGTAGFHKNGTTEQIWRWQCTGKKAVEVALAIKPFAPSRQEAITAFENWENDSGNVEAQKTTALSLKEHGGRDTVTKEVYVTLVRNQIFMAGVIDTRGYKSGENQAIKSTNLALLEAIKDEYGGALKLSTRSGEEKTIESREFVTKSNSYNLRLKQSFVVPNIGI